MGWVAVAQPVGAVEEQATAMGMGGVRRIAAAGLRRFAVSLWIEQGVPPECTELGWACHHSIHHGPLWTSLVRPNLEQGHRTGHRGRLIVKQTWM